MDINKKMRGVMESFGPIVIEWLTMRKKDYNPASLKGSSDFETVWNVAERAGQHKELVNIIDDLNNL